MIFLKLVFGTFGPAPGPREGRSHEIYNLYPPCPLYASYPNLKRIGIAVFKKLKMFIRHHTLFCRRECCVLFTVFFLPSGGQK
jgi:hypothetical protein